MLLELPTGTKQTAWSETAASDDWAVLEEVTWNETVYGEVFSWRSVITDEAVKVLNINNNKKNYSDITPLQKQQSTWF